MEYKDGEVIGVEQDGTLVCWNADEHRAYNCGETAEDFGLHNLTEIERKRVVQL